MNLQLTCFVLVSALTTGYAVLDGFDLGVGVLYPILARNEDERSVLRTAIGPVWDGNEVWLITAGGALFAAFPPVYAMTFSGFYLVIMLVLFALIFRAVALEFRHREDRWPVIWDVAFFVGSLVPALLFGVATGNLIRGVPLSAEGDYAGTFGELLNPVSLLVGVTGLAMFVQHGAAWAAVKSEGALHARATRARSIAQAAFVALVAALTVVAGLTLKSHFHNVTHRPIGWVLVMLLAGGIVWGRWAMVRKRDRAAFLGSAASIVALVGLAAVGNYPALVPARGTPAATGLTVHTASASSLALKVMTVLLLVGLALAVVYTVWVYRTFKGKAHAGEY